MVCEEKKVMHFLQNSGLYCAGTLTLHLVQMFIACLALLDADPISPDLASSIA
jgi:hypothetical protein